MSDALLATRGVTKHFGGLTALEGVDLDVAAGSITGLIGPNGAGKTTLFDAVTGTVPSDRGRITFRGVDLTGLPPHRIVGHGLVRTFQQPRVLTRLSVTDNLLLAGDDQPGESLPGWVFRWRAAREREDRLRERATSLLRLVDLAHMADELAGTLSGGQRKLLEFARALMTDPSMVLLDEPLAGVNPTLADTLTDLIVRLRDREQMTFLIIEHDLPTIMRLCDTITVLNDGVVVADGPPAAVRGDAAVIEAYLGERASGEPA